MKTRRELIEDIVKLIGALKWRGYHSINWKIDRKGRQFSMKQVLKRWKWVEVQLDDDKIKAAHANLTQSYLNGRLLEEIKAQRTKHLAEIGITYEP